MQAPNAQGLAGLMSQPRPMPQPDNVPKPQGQPMPNPGTASPMAGLGSVEDRVAAYRGNPAPLQQRYAMSQDLLDLLALQKIKSEKEAAARQMQLAMGQQQAAQGMEPPTVAQQREKEVMELTKNELAQQRGELAQQQSAQQQAAMQKLMGGIAAAPGANAVAQPKAMASGGIVTFAEGGTPKGEVVRLSEEQLRRLYEVDPKLADRARRGMLTRAALATLAPSIAFGVIEGGGAALAEDAANTMRAMSPEQRRDFYRTPLMGAQAGDAGIAGAILNAGDGEIPPSNMPYGEQMLNVAKAPFKAAGSLFKHLVSAPGYGFNRDIRATEAGNQPPVSDTYPDETSRGTAASISAAPPARSKPPGITGLPAAGPRPTPAPAAPAAPAQPSELAGLQALNTKTATALQNRDPRAEGLAEEQRIEGRLSFPEEQARRAKYAERLQALYDQEFDPERQRREGIKQFLLGAGGRRYGEFGAGAQAAMGYDEDQRKRQIERLKGIEDVNQGIFSLRKGATEAGITAGAGTRKEAEAGQRSGLEAGSRIVEGALDRESRERIARENNRVQAMISQATKEQTLEIRRGSLMQEINRTEATAMSALQRGPVARSIANLEQMRAFNPKGFTKAQEDELNGLRRQLNDAEDAIRAQHDVYREQIGGIAGVNRGRGGTALSPEDKALVDKYKGK